MADKAGNAQRPLEKESAKNKNGAAVKHGKKKNLPRLKPGRTFTGL